MKNLLYIFILLLVGCAPDCGIITYKKYEPSHTVTNTDWMEVGDTKIPIITTETIPDKYWFKIEQNNEGKIKRGWVQVDSYDYHNKFLGEWYEK